MDQLTTTDLQQLGITITPSTSFDIVFVSAIAIAAIIGLIGYIMGAR